MFSSIFGKRRSSPVEDETPPIPGPKPDDEFVVIDHNSPGGSLYPSISGNPNIKRPAPAPPLPSIRTNSEQTFHYLQGVPFQLSKQLQMSLNKDAYTSEIADLLAFLVYRIKTNEYNYDFSVEKSVLKEC